MHSEAIPEQPKQAMISAAQAQMMDAAQAQKNNGHNFIPEVGIDNEAMEEMGGEGEDNRESYYEQMV